MLIAIIASTSINNIISIEKETNENEELTSENEIKTDLEKDADTNKSNDLNQKRIVYIKDDNVWVMDSSGQDKIQITSDGNEFTKYGCVDWKETDVISYSKCDGSCGIYIYDLISEQELLFLEMMPFTQSIDAIRWSNDGTKLAYLFKKGDSSREASLYTGDEDVRILTSYEMADARGIEHSDGIDISFTSDDSKVLVFNTFTRYKSEDKPIQVFSINGELLLELDNYFSPTFVGNDKLFYLETIYSIEDNGYYLTYLIENEMNSLSSRKITEFQGRAYNLNPSYDNNHLAFWGREAMGLIDNSYYFDLGDNSINTLSYGSMNPDWSDEIEYDSVNTISFGSIMPKWLNENEVIVISSKLVDYPGLSSSIQSTGLSKINFEGVITTPLDTGIVWAFELEKKL